MQKTKIFLMFVGEQCGKAEEAIRLYTSLIPNSEIKKIERWAEGEPSSVAGQVKTALFTLAGTEYMASENTGGHQFTFTPAISIFIECNDEAEIIRLHAELSKGGKEFMPMDNYGFSKKFTWIEDRFGVSWQLNLASECVK
jgi:predicted 3-demethylubiquinone-9 3-methyltransferase (glyoxalase superfamily)